MAITSSQIQLIQSAVMADVPEGGGAPSGVPIIDGTSNAILPDVSEMDRAIGRVSFRKVFGQVASADADTYFGANVVVAEPPKDPRVSVTITKGQPFDVRADAKTRIESYLAAGPVAAGYLFENHIAGQRAIQLFLHPSDAMPNVGAVLVLRQNEGQPTQKEQFLRVTKVDSVLRTFKDEQGKDYQANVVTATVSDALRQDYTGSPANDKFKPAAGAARVRETLVADAGSYCGVVPLAQAANLGDFSIKAASIFTQLVPSAQTEVPMAAQLPYADLSTPVLGVADVSYTAAQNWTTALALVLPSPAAPGSININAGAVTDDGAGILMAGGAQFGTVDYANGILSINTGSLNGAKAVTYRPAGFVLRAPRSMETRVTIETRSLSYVGVVAPLPSPGTLSVAYRAQGRWYVLREAGGIIKGSDSSYGAGTYNPSTGAYIITLGALPDVGSSVIFTWGAQADEFALPAAGIKAAQTMTLANLPRTSTVSFSWPHENGTDTRTAAAAADGTISGDATGTVVGTQVLFSPNVFPPAGAAIGVGYSQAAAQQTEDLDTAPDGGDMLAVQAGTTPLAAGTVRLVYGLRIRLEAVLAPHEIEFLHRERDVPNPFMVAITDDGAGNLLLPEHLSANGFSIGFSQRNVGTVDYSTGEISFNPIAVSINGWVTKFWINPQSGYTWGYKVRHLSFSVEFVDKGYNGAKDCRLVYETAAASTTHTESAAFAPTLDLAPGFAAPLAAGSVVLTGGGFSVPLGDNGLGALRTINADGSVTQRGSINYINREAELTSWTAGAANAFTRAAAVVTGGKGYTASGVFRTAAAPLRPGSLSVQYAAPDGSGTITLTAGLDGVINGAGLQGTVDHEAGIVRLAFGAMVTAAGHEAEPWYNAAAVDENGKIWRPEFVALDSLRYSCVAYSYLPLDADILGLDPVRLPSDGRVPIFRAGGLVVVGHTGRVAGSVANGQTVDCGRVRLSRVRVVGDDGALINTGWSADLEAGTVTFSNVIGYAQPVTIEHRIEDMVLVRDVQIDGSLSFTRPLTHDYPTPTGGDPRTGSYVASALVAGDIFARTSLTFDQQTWSGAWSDVVIGNEATATFNAALYPIAVTNAGALTERWAVRFTSSTGFEVMGEHVGTVAVGNTAADCAPLNPATGAPYFSIPALGWGSGWVVGNVLRFNTIAANVPVWVLRTVQQGPETVADDDFTLLLRGDVDTP